VELIIGAITALLGLIGMIWKNWEAFKGLYKRSIGRRGAQLDRIEDELTGNGGTKLRCAITRIEQRQYSFEAFVNAQLNIGTDAIFRTTPDGLCYYTNRPHQRLTGVTIAEMRGTGWINCVHPDWRVKVQASWDKAVAEKREFSEDIMYISVEGDPYMVHVMGYREIDQAGNLRGYLGVVTLIEDNG